MTDNIKPEHYRTGEIDLFESWYRTRPFNEFRAIMESIAERYMKRDKEDRIIDLDKAMETLKRLREYEEKEREKIAHNYKIDEGIFLLEGLLERGFEYLARNKDDELWTYDAEPNKLTQSWADVDGEWAEKLGEDYFPEVQWTDDEPTRIVDLLATYQNGGENGK